MNYKCISMEELYSLNRENNLWDFARMDCLVEDSGIEESDEMERLVIKNTRTEEQIFIKEILEVNKMEEIKQRAYEGSFDFPRKIMYAMIKNECEDKIKLKTKDEI